MAAKRSIGRSTLGKKERQAIASRKTRKVNPETLIAALKSLLERQEPLEDDVVTTLANIRHLDCMPEEALPLLDQLLEKHPPRRPPGRI